MADVFISYGSEDRLKASVLAKLFSNVGWDVWWDKEILGGKEWSPEILEEVRKARCVVVLWSRDSVKKEWVKKEAEEAEKNGTLIPVLLQPSSLETPTPSIQAVKLSTWDGGNVDEVIPLLKSIADKIKKEIGLSVDEYSLAIRKSLREISRVEVAQVVFDYCAVALRHEILRLNGYRFSKEELDEKGIAYDNLVECLAPEGSEVNQEDLHELMCRFMDVLHPENS